ncbi:hypothetical protein AQ962_12830 [Burkholderia pseudomallei]|nr:hypothetical protein AQ804_01305 [Burkholderia pseudomallei]OMW33076.1 hypothetical protein AQ805_12955 [Burkholderia pseudomallei]ONF05047.1 hypothetical protein AQ961_04615 [Burkholderia pseudomallei]ONF10429.1 hypothetical protein AQ962_12830 [Burkholderia pseudomallei]ONF31960.1 hypothetical protein AQ963_10285 [Burkholderia pseudomallei]
MTLQPERGKLAVVHFIRGTRRPCRATVEAMLFQILLFEFEFDTCAALCCDGEQVPHIVSLIAMHCG